MLAGDAKKQYQREWLRKRRDAFFSDKACVKCGSTDRLELDHIDPSTKLYAPSRLWGMSDKNPAKHAELTKCQVLCYLCHKDKTNGIGGDLHSMRVTTSKRMICSHGHDMKKVGFTSHTKPNGFIKKYCSYCAHLYNAGRRGGKVKTLNEFISWRKTK